MPSLIPVDVAAISVTIICMIVACCAGLAVSLLGKVLGGVAEVGVGFLEAVAGGRPTYVEKKRVSALPVFIRSLLYVVGGMAAIVVAGSGYSVLGALLGVFCAFAFGVAVVTFFSRISA